MFKTAFKSLSIMFLVWAACVPIVVVPGVHFLLIIIVPLVPFVVAYRTSQKTQPNGNNVGMQGLTFGFVVGVVILVVIIVLLMLGSQLGIYEFEGRAKALMWIILFIAPLHCGSISALGFMYGMMRSRKSVID